MVAQSPIVLGQYSPSQNGIVVSPFGPSLCVSGGGQIARTIKYQYYKTSLANFLLKTQRGATGVLIEYDF